MRYVCCCSDVTKDEWDSLMKGARKCSYWKLVRRIKTELPMLYEKLALGIYNPYCGQCRQTRTHYILVHSMIEYFIAK